MKKYELKKPSVVQSTKKQVQYTLDKLELSHCMRCSFSSDSLYTEYTAFALGFSEMC